MADDDGLTERLRRLRERCEEGAAASERLRDRLRADASSPVALGAVGVAVRVHDRHGNDLGLATVPPPVVAGDILDLGRGPILPLRVADVVETPHSAIAARVRVAPAIALGLP